MNRFYAFSVFMSSIMGFLIGTIICPLEYLKIPMGFIMGMLFLSMFAIILVNNSVINEFNELFCTGSNPSASRTFVVILIFVQIFCVFISFNDVFANFTRFLVTNLVLFVVLLIDYKILGLDLVLVEEN